MAKRFKTRVKRTITKNYVDKQLDNKLKQNVLTVNKRLRQLKRSKDLGSWASKKLIERLSGGKLESLNLYNNGRLDIRKKLNMTQKNAILRASKQFLASKTSTHIGINLVEEETKKSMYRTLKIENDKLTKQDIETYYDMLGDKDFDFFTKSDRIGASELWANIDTAIEAGDTKGQFLKRLGRYENINDKEIREKLANIYEKYVL